MREKVKIEMVIEVELTLYDCSVYEAMERFGVTDSWYMSDIFCDSHTVKSYKLIEQKEERTADEIWKEADKCIICSTILEEDDGDTCKECIKDKKKNNDI